MPLVERDGSNEEDIVVYLNRGVLVYDGVLFGDMSQAIVVSLFSSCGFVDCLSTRDRGMRAENIWTAQPPKKRKTGNSQTINSK